MTAIELLAFRFESLEQARSEFKDEFLFSSLKDESQELHQATVETFTLIKSSISKGEHVQELPDISNLKNRICADLKELGSNQNLMKISGR